MCAKVLLTGVTMLKTMRFVWVGKLRTSFWRDAAGHYWKQLGRHYRLQERCVKDAAGTMSAAERCRKEGEGLLAALEGGERTECAVSLDEHGRQLRSPELAEFVASQEDKGCQGICFVVGGAYGLSSDVLGRCDYSLSLSSMTFPHEMARVVLLEQLFRAVSILKGLPYHH